MESETEYCLLQLQNLLFNSSHFFNPYYDATGKLGSSLLDGDTVWLGGYEQCQSLPESRYCLADLEVDLQEPGFSNESRSSLVRWGICGVKACTEEIIRRNISSIFEGFFKFPWMNITTADVRCSQAQRYSAGFCVTLILLICLVLFCMAGTIADLWHRRSAQMRWSLIYRISGDGPHLVAPRQFISIDQEQESCHVSASSLSTMSSDAPATSAEHGNSNEAGNTTVEDAFNRPPSQNLLERAYNYKPGVLVQFANCFSLVSNMKALTHQSTDGVRCLYGFRVLAYLLVVLGNTTLGAFESNILANPKVVTEHVRRLSWQIVGNAYVAVDSFLFLGGFCVAYTSLKRCMRQDGQPNVFVCYFRRYVRLTPSVLIVMLFWMFIKPYTSDGPQWYAMQSGGGCNKYWWSNLLYIQNFYPISSDNICLGWLWYLAVDWQLFLLSPLLLIALSRNKSTILVVPLVICSIVVTAVLIGYYKIEVNLTKSVIGRDVDMISQYVNIIWTKPYCRAVPYLVGLWLGHRIFIEKEAMVKIRKVHVAIGWLLCIVLALSTIFATYPEFLGHKFGSVGNVVYGSVRSLAWSLSMSWLVYASCHGYAGPVGSLLSWGGWIPISRLTFGAYLTHGVYLFVFYFSQSSAFFLSDMAIASVYLSTIFISYASSAVIAFIVELPIRNIFAPCTS